MEHIKYQIVYESNIDYETTYEKLCSLIPGVDKTRKGHIRFWLRQPRKIAILISPRGRVQIDFVSIEEKQRIIPLLESVLVPEEGASKVTLRAVKANIQNFPHPGPPRFRIAWCNQISTYIQTVQNFIANKTLRPIPKIDNGELLKRVNRSMRCSAQIEQEYERKARIPIIGRLFYRSTLQAIRENRESIRQYVEEVKREDYDFLAKCTEIKVEAGKGIPCFDELIIQGPILDALYAVMREARAIAEINNQEFPGEDSGLNIVISCNFERKHAPPHRATMREDLELIEKLDSEWNKMFGLTPERIANLKKADEKLREIKTKSLKNVTAQWQNGE